MELYLVYLSKCKNSKAATQSNYPCLLTLHSAPHRNVDLTQTYFHILTAITFQQLNQSVNKDGICVTLAFISVYIRSLCMLTIALQKSQQKLTVAVAVCFYLCCSSPTGRFHRSVSRSLLKWCLWARVLICLPAGASRSTGRLRVQPAG